MMGRTLGHFRILDKLGEGGMGEVYRAHDSKLGRDVAIKVLPDEFARDEERLRRFQREAKVLASLNHPNIAAIHGLEQSGSTHYLVLELVPGETLAERIARGPIPIDEALTIAVKVAEALEEAHEHGIVHRDLKPANIKLTPDDKVKVLDFGLAKAFVDDTAEADSSMSPTITRDATRVGVILGTAAYMSPEQAKGKRVDRRTDIFAFGAVLYEMLTGRKAFPGEDVSDVLASVIKLEPEWSVLPDALPATVERLVRRCLRKDSNRRLQHIGDARIEIEDASAEPTRSPRSELPKRIHRVTATAVIVAAAALGIALWSLNRAGPSPGKTIRTSIGLPAEHELNDGNTTDLAISPNGENVAYIATSNGTTQLYLRAMSTLEAVAVSGSQGAFMPFFSPDSQWVGFLAGRQLMKVAVSGGAPITVADVAGGGGLRGACWTDRNEIVFNGALGQGLYRVSAAGGEPQMLTSTDRERMEKTHRFPEPLPGGTSVLFTLATGDIDSFDDASIAVLSLDTGEYEVVLEGGTNARYSPSGHLVYARDGSLLAVPFDLESSRVTGSPVPVVDDVVVSFIYGHAQFSISDDGSLLFARGDAWGNDNRVVWVDRAGVEQPLIETPRPFENVRVSPDGQYLALYVEGANGNVWVHDIERATSTRLTFGYDSFFPLWTPDGERVTFVSTRSDPANLFWQPADGSGEAEPLTTGEVGGGPSSWSPDGQTLALGGGDINLLSLQGDPVPAPFFETDFGELMPTFSPDGRWIAYVSNESGANEVYLRAYPSAAGKRQVSSGGGWLPRWSPGGDELFYLDGERMMAVDVETNGGLTLGEPEVLFEKATTGSYDVAPDGERFVMVVPAETERPASELILVQNWTQELERLVPTR